MKVPNKAASDIRTVDVMNGGLAEIELSSKSRTAKPRAARPPRYTFRKPDKGDGAAMWALVKETGVLDLNSAYSYLMLGEYFSDTCVIAERKGRVVGFVTGFIPPERPDTIFVWQVGVASSERGKGLGKQVLLELLRSEVCQDVHYIESTITPSNAASTRLFRAMARELHTSCVIDDGFHEKLFPGEGHESERLFRIGPF